MSETATGATLFLARRLVDGLGGPARRDAAVLVQNGRIVAVGDRASMHPAPGVEVVDLGDLTLIPGLIDMHVHLGYISRSRSPQTTRPSPGLLVLRAADQASTWLRSGVTTARQLGTQAFLDVGLKEEIRDGKINGPRLHVSGPMITFHGGPRDALDDWKLEVTGGIEMRRQVARHLKSGADWIKLYAATLLEPLDHYAARICSLDPDDQLGAWGVMTEEEIRAAVREVRKTGRRVAPTPRLYTGLALAPAPASTPSSTAPASTGRRLT